MLVEDDTRILIILCLTILPFLDTTLVVNTVPISYSFSWGLCTHTDLWTLLILNLIVSIAGVVTINTDHALRVRSPEYLTTMGVAIAYLILFAPGSLFCWFLPAYHAYRYTLDYMYLLIVVLCIFLIRLCHSPYHPRAHTHTHTHTHTVEETALWHSCGSSLQWHSRFLAFFWEP